jgi:hypothetical protein
MTRAASKVPETHITPKPIMTPVVPCARAILSFVIAASLGSRAALDWFASQGAATDPVEFGARRRDR